jgi:hypothetical protein
MKSTLCAIAVQSNPSDLTKLRAAFQIVGRDDIRLNETVTTIANNHGPNALQKTCIWLDGYLKQTARCTACNFPVTIAPIETIGTVCNKWQLDFSSDDNVIHKFCKEKKLAAIEDQYNTMANELKLLKQLKVDLEKIKNKKTDNKTKDHINKLNYLMNAVKSLLITENFTEAVYWNMECAADPLLVKRCHLSTCCKRKDVGHYNPIRYLELHRLFHPGQIDTGCYVHAICPYQKKPRPKNPYPMETEQAITSDDDDRKLPPVAKELLRIKMEASKSIPTKLLKIAIDTNSHLDDLRCLYLTNQTDSKTTIIPRFEPPEPAVKQWDDQKAICVHCLKPMLHFQHINWDTYNGYWYWMHSECNKNVWAINGHLPAMCLEEKERRWVAYDLRHQVNRLFASLMADNNMWKDAIIPFLERYSARLIQQAIVEPLCVFVNMKSNKPLYQTYRELYRKSVDAKNAWLEVCKNNKDKHIYFPANDRELIKSTEISKITEQSSLSGSKRQTLPDPPTKHIKY